MKPLINATVAMIQIVYHVLIQIIVMLVQITIHYLTILFTVFLRNFN